MRVSYLTPKFGAATTPFLKCIYIYMCVCVCVLFTAEMQLTMMYHHTPFLDRYKEWNGSLDYRIDCVYFSSFCIFVRAFIR